MISHALLILLACTKGDDSPPEETGPVDDSGVVEADVCGDQGLTTLDFDATAPAAYQRWEPAGDFSVPLTDGSTWTLSENWTGCDTYLFIPHWWSVSAYDDQSFWTTGVADLIAASPANVHYFFVVGGSDDPTDHISVIQSDIDATLVGLDEDSSAWWLDRLHVVNSNSDSLAEGLVYEMFDDDIGAFGWGIDRTQKIRTLGYMPAVEAFDSALYSAGEWPWEFRLYSAASEAIYFNFEAERQARLDARSLTTVEIFGSYLGAEYEDTTVSLPSAADMAGFDTLTVDVTMECQDRTTYEINNCGAWDYLAHLWVQDPETESWLEMSRFITTYHRESRWVVDATQALAWLKDGGERNFRYEWAPSWNTQPTIISVQLHFSNEGKGMAPSEITPLFQGGSFSTTYNDDRPPVDVEVPSDATKVELWSIATGHGADSNNCSEFCDHSHHYTIGGTTWSQEFKDVSSDTGCKDKVGDGTVPNQAGTWWFGRAGWCPGQRVDPFVVDVTADATLGGTTTVAYEAEVVGGAPQDSQGDAQLYSWLVVYR